METYFEYFVNTVFGLSLFFNAILFIPQARALFNKKDATSLSLFTFLGFNVMQIFTALHGYFVKDYILMLGFLLSFITCAVVTGLIIYYRFFKKTSTSSL